MANQLARRIRNDRIQAELTQAQLADKAGVHYSTISKFEIGQLTGRRGDAADTVIAIAQALGQQPRDYLILAGHIVPDQEPTFADLVHGRTDLTDGQKRALVELYDTFTRSTSGS